MKASGNHFHRHHPNNSAKHQRGPVNGSALQSSVQKATADQLEAFEVFLNSEGLQDVMRAFHSMCDAVNVVPSCEDPRRFYQQLRQRFRSHWKANHLFEKLDKRAESKVYKLPNGSRRLRTLIVGAGPCGLRMAIEFAFLGHQTIVVEKRTYFSRKNVLYLWQFVIDDLVSLGAKHFCGQFCAGSISHSSIRTLQYILLKVALLLGVQVFCGIDFNGIIYPMERGGRNEGSGWRANIAPSNHMLSTYEFDVLIGADGRRNNMPGFLKDSTRCKMAIAVTANFERTYDQDETQVEELNGRAFHFNQEYFHQIQEATGVLLENIVYYRDETNYFIMTPHKDSLLKRGVLKENFGRSEELLHPSNIDQKALEAMVRDVANFCTNYQLVNKLVFSQNHHHINDVSIFDFTTVKRSRNACRVIRRFGHQLLLALVGDSLSEPFWPLGTGCAHGFLSVLDTAWTVRNLSFPQYNLVEVLHERECLYTLLKGAHLKDKRLKYSIDPTTRYKESYRNAVPISVARSLVDSDEPLAVISPNSPSNITFSPMMADNAVSLLPTSRKRRQPSMDQPLPSLTSPNPSIGDSSPMVNGSSAVTGQHLLFLCYNWFHTRLSRYSEIVQIHDLCNSWLDGKALLCLVHCFKPELIELNTIQDDPLENLRVALGLLQKHFNVAPVLSAEEILLDPPDRISLVYYLQALYNEMKHLEPARANHPEPKIQSRQDRIQHSTNNSVNTVTSHHNTSSTSVGFLKTLMEGSRILRRSAGGAGDSVQNIVPKGALKKQREHLVQKLKGNEEPLRSSQELENATASKKRFVKKEKSTGRVSVSAAVRNLFSGGGGVSKEGTPQPSQTDASYSQSPFGSTSVTNSLFSPGRQCRICKQVGILLVERVVLQDGSVVHRDCLRCSECNVTLEPHECHLYIGLNSRPVNNETTSFEIRCVNHFVPETPLSTVRYSPTLKHLISNRRQRVSSEKNVNPEIPDPSHNKNSDKITETPSENSADAPTELVPENVNLNRSSSCGRRNVQSIHIGSPSLFPRLSIDSKSNKMSSSVEVLFEVNGSEIKATEHSLLPRNSSPESFHEMEPILISSVPGWHRPTQEWADNLLREKQTFWSRNASPLSLESSVDSENVNSREASNSPTALNQPEAIIAAEEKQLHWFKELENLRQPQLMEPYFGSSEASPDDTSICNTKVTVTKPAAEKTEPIVNMNTEVLKSVEMNWDRLLSLCVTIRKHRSNLGNHRNKASRKEWLHTVRSQTTSRRVSYTPSISSNASLSSSSTVGSGQPIDHKVCCCYSGHSSASTSSCSSVIMALQPEEYLSVEEKPPLIEEKLDYNKNSASILIGDMDKENKPLHVDQETDKESTLNGKSESDSHGPPTNLNASKTLQPFSDSSQNERGSSLPRYPSGPPIVTTVMTPDEEKPNVDINITKNISQNTDQVLSAAARRMQFMMQPAKPVSIDSKGFIAEMNRNRARLITMADPREEIKSGDDFCERALFPVPALTLFPFHDAVHCLDLQGRTDALQVYQVKTDYDPRYLLRPISRNAQYGLRRGDSMLSFLMDSWKGDALALRRQRSSSISSITTAAAFNPSSFFGLDDMKDIDSISIMTEIDVFIPPFTSNSIQLVSKESPPAVIDNFKQQNAPLRAEPEESMLESINSVSVTPQHHASISSFSYNDGVRFPPAPPLPNRKQLHLSPSDEFNMAASCRPTVHSSSVVNVNNKVSTIRSDKGDKRQSTDDEEEDTTPESETPQESEIERVPYKPVVFTGTNNNHSSNATIPTRAEISEGDNLSDGNILDAETEPQSIEKDNGPIPNTDNCQTSGQPKLPNEKDLLTEANPIVLPDSLNTKGNRKARQRNIRFGNGVKVKKISKNSTPPPPGRHGTSNMHENERNGKLHKKKWSGPGSLFGFLKRSSRSHGNLSQSAVKRGEKFQGKDDKVVDSKDFPSHDLPSCDTNQKASIRSPSTDALDEALLWRPRSTIDVPGGSSEHPQSPNDGTNLRKPTREFSSSEIFSSPQRREQQRNRGIYRKVQRPFSFTADGSNKGFGGTSDQLCQYLDNSLSSYESDISSEEDHIQITETAATPDQHPPISRDICSPIPIDSHEIKQLRCAMRKSFRTLQAQVKARTEEENLEHGQDDKTSESKQLINERSRMEVAIKRQRQEQEATIMQRSQDIQCEKEDLENLLQQYTERGKELEMRLRSHEQEVGLSTAVQPFKSDTTGQEANTLLDEWFEVVSKQKHIEQHLNELHFQSKEVELEYQQCRLLENYRLKQLEELVDGKDLESRRQDRELLKEYIRLVEERDTLVALLNEQRQRIRNEQVIIPHLPILSSSSNPVGVLESPVSYGQCCISTPRTVTAQTVSQYET